MSPRGVLPIGDLLPGWAWLDCVCRLLGLFVSVSSDNFSGEGELVPWLRGRVP